MCLGIRSSQDDQQRGCREVNWKRLLASWPSFERTQKARRRTRERSWGDRCQEDNARSKDKNKNSSSAVDTTLNRKFYYSHFHYLCRRWAGGPCWSNAYGVGLSNRFRDRRTRRRALATYRDPHRVGKRDRHRLVLEAVAFVFRVGSNSE